MWYHLYVGFMPSFLLFYVLYMLGSTFALAAASYCYDMRVDA